ncbi:MAG: hypothetical protein IJN17_00985 [Clostridia bacterium]|nr:hypothetical protein [Clostridia bacterium]
MLLSVLPFALLLFEYRRKITTSKQNSSLVITESARTKPLPAGEVSAELTERDVAETTSSVSAA